MVADLVVGENKISLSLEGAGLHAVLKILKFTL